MNRIMTDHDIWPMLCKAIPALADIPLVTGMTLELNIEAEKVSLVHITHCAENPAVSGELTVATYRLQQNGQDVVAYELWKDLCRALPYLKELSVAKCSLWVTVHQIVTMDIECQVCEPESGRLLSQMYELVEVKA